MYDEKGERRLKAYFAHPYIKRKSADKYRIRTAMLERKIEVVDPFIKEFKILRKYGIKEYYEKPDFRAARDIWIKDLKQIRSVDIIVLWFPDIEYPCIGTSAELMYALEYQKRLRYEDKDKKPEDRRPFMIQIISARKHPLFAYALQNGNQQFESISDYEKLNVMRW